MCPNSESYMYLGVTYAFITLTVADGFLVHIHVNTYQMIYFKYVRLLYVKCASIKLSLIKKNKGNIREKKNQTTIGLSSLKIQLWTCFPTD